MKKLILLILLFNVSGAMAGSEVSMMKNTDSESVKCKTVVKHKTVSWPDNEESDSEDIETLHNGYEPSDNLSVNTDDRVIFTADNIDDKDLQEQDDTMYKLNALNAIANFRAKRNGTKPQKELSKMEESFMANKPISVAHKVLHFVALGDIEFAKRLGKMRDSVGSDDIEEGMAMNIACHALGQGVRKWGGLKDAGAYWHERQNSSWSWGSDNRPPYGADNFRATCLITEKGKDTAYGSGQIGLKTRFYPITMGKIMDCFKKHGMMVDHSSGNGDRKGGDRGIWFKIDPNQPNTSFVPKELQEYLNTCEAAKIWGSSRWVEKENDGFKRYTFNLTSKGEVVDYKEVDVTEFACDCYETPEEADAFVKALSNFKIDFNDMSGDPHALDGLDFSSSGPRAR